MSRSIVIVALLGTLVLSFLAIVRAPSSGAQLRLPADTVHPELAYLKQVNQWRPLSDPQFAAERMMKDGRHELAANYLRWAQTKLPDSPRLNESHRLAYLKLMDKDQEFNPFKLIVYAGEINQSVM